MFSVTLGAEEPVPDRPMPGAGAQQVSPQNSNVPAWVYPPKQEYQVGDKINPFIPFVAATTKGKENLTDPTPLLERFATGQIKLRGVLSASSGYVAVFELPNAKGVTARMGDRVGKADGVITEITSDHVKIEEPVKNIFGETEPNTVTLYLQPEGKPTE